MISIFGNSLIVLILLSTLSIIYFSFNSITSLGINISKKIYHLSLLQVTFVITCLLTLIVGFIISDFSLTTVFENSHTQKPLIYKIAGTWGNHEGSLLLWITLMVFFNFLFLVYGKKYEKKFMLFSLISQNFLILSFILFLFFTSNPFLLINPAPIEGLGLNPILQDPALAIHPPLLYIGFVGSSIYFSSAIGALISNLPAKDFAASIKNWVIFTWFFQTLGIFAGSVWAYYELGWGGFWFWDPVENASLLPWFCMTALMHSIIVLEKKGQLYSWVLILCLMTFVLTIAGTFLVRSGILNSVHTFANDPTRGLYILIILLLACLVSFFIFIKHSRGNSIQGYNLDRGTFILSNNWFMIFYLVTVFLGTVYPIFTEVIFNTKISVGPPFYNTVIIPFVIVFLILMSLGPESKWIKTKFPIKKLLAILILSFVLNLIISVIFKSTSLISNLIFITSFFLIIMSFLDVIKLIQLNKITLISRSVSHLGFGLLILFIGLNHNFSKEYDVNIKTGEIKKLNNFDLKFKDLKLTNSQNYKSIIGNFELKDNDKNLIKELKPEIRIYQNPETLTYEASIKSTIFNDYYLTMSNLQNSEYYNVKVQVKPFMSWLWLSVLIMSLGGFLRLFYKR
tara:strand:+ start:152 stop:2026 length:1875 start_codon:yes stop_codon:yes gene_type:complete